jgi:hypothetical protein
MIRADGRADLFLDLASCRVIHVFGGSAVGGHAP